MATTDPASAVKAIDSNAFLTGENRRDRSAPVRRICAAPADPVPTLTTTRILRGPQHRAGVRLQNIFPARRFRLPISNGHTRLPPEVDRERLPYTLTSSPGAGVAGPSRPTHAGARPAMHAERPTAA